MMSSLGSWIMLWGQFEAGRLRLRPNASPQSLLMLLILILSGATLVWVINRIVAARQRHVRNNPRALFRELSRAHQLSFVERHMLKKLAAQHKMEDAVQMFVEPNKLVAGPTTTEFQRYTIAVLRRKLFGLDAVANG